jgi:predicted dehydrogenase
MSTNITRRGFLKSAAVAAGITIVPSRLLCGAPARVGRTYAANEKVNVGIIGAGGQGAVNRKWLQNDGANIVALCDVDGKRVEAAAKDHPGAKTWADFRKMLDEQKEIDGVMVSTADHTHAVASMMAMKLGKGVCTEKPLTHSVYEARALAEAARKYKVATQLDNENHSADGLRMLVEWVRAGAIGKVTEVHIWTDRPIWPQGIAQRPPTKPVPANLDWDLWIGPAPFRDFHEHLHPFSWRGWWDFGCGALGDMGCHFWDSAFWALELGHPATVEAEQEGNSKETGPNWSTVTYQFPPVVKETVAACRDPKQGVVVKWWDGRRPRKLPDGTVKYDIPNLPPRPEELEQNRKLPSNGSMFVGEKGTILVSDAASPRLIPEEKMKAYQRPAPFIPRSKGHKIEWLEAIKGGPAAGSDFADYGGPLTEVVLLGNVAIRAGKKIEWDPVNLKAKNAPDVDQYVKREYRKGWEL